MVLSENEDPTRKLGRNLATSSGGALLGAAIGGPVGAVIGGAVGPAADFFYEAHKRRLARANRIAAGVAKLTAMSADEVFQRLADSPELGDLGYRVLEISVSDEQPDRDNALMVLLAEALHGDQSKDNLQHKIMVEVLGDLRKPHIEVLRFISGSKSEHSGSKSPDEIFVAFPAYEDVLRSLVRTLELHGLIVDDNRLSKQPTNEISWRVSELGAALVGIVETARKEIGEDE